MIVITGPGKTTLCCALISVFSVFQYFINIIKLWPEGQITDNLHFFKTQQNIKNITYLQNN